MDDFLHDIPGSIKTNFSEPQQRQDYLSKRVQTAFQVALGKFLDTNGNLEVVIQTAEAFGRGLYAEFLQDKSNIRTMKDWIQSTITEVLQPMGQELITIHTNDIESLSHLTRCPIQQHTQEPHLASLFTYGLLRGLLLSAFPEGELLMGSTLAEGATKTEFIFKTTAQPPDHKERERIKTHLLTKLRR